MNLIPETGKGWTPERSKSSRTSGSSGTANARKRFEPHAVGGLSERRDRQGGPKDGGCQSRIPGTSWMVLRMGQNRGSQPKMSMVYSFQALG